ncbi:NUDIX hydrolase [Allostella vacuolata]|nr:NUDIX hydrolase [Stella vacuolata]
MAAVRIQYGVLPYRLSPDGDLQILLLTTRRTGRWSIPKGWPIKGLKPPKSAAREAYEEAGLRGKVGGRAIGSFAYTKVVEGETALRCEVQVFPLAVKKQLISWPEGAQRDTVWLAAMDALAVVDKAELRPIIERFVARFARPAM